MEFIKPGTQIDFMGIRKPVITVSVILVLLSIVSVFLPAGYGPNYGIDFRGGTELQLAFKGDVRSGELRSTLESLGYNRPDVVAVEGAPNEFIIRVQEVNAVTDDQRNSLQNDLPGKLPGVDVERVKWSPGGDKVTVDLTGRVDENVLRGHIEEAGVKVRNLVQFGQDKDFRYEAQLVGVADKLVDQLSDKLGAKGPESPRRVEWVGPKAGQQLKEAAIKSMLYAIAFIMVYVAFRFDLRFAPGGLLALLHDALLTVGVYVLFQKEVNLTMVAALLTIVGYSINDTIVVFDRIRENMGRMRDRSLADLINISASQMLSRTIVTSGTTLMSVCAFFIWGTSVIQDIAFALIIGILVGTYSSIFIAAPATEWMDKRFFSRARA